MTISEKISRIFGAGRQFTPKSLKFQIGVIVKFHEEDPVYARVVSLQELLESNPHYMPRKKLIGIGDWVCLMVANGLYTSMPTSALKEVDFDTELTKLRKNRADAFDSYGKKAHIETLLYGYDMNIAFLEKVKVSYKPLD